MAEKKTVARPYARAIFELAVRARNFEQWSTLLTLLCHIVSDPRVQKLLRDPTLRLATIEEFFLGLPLPFLGEEGQNLIKTLAMRKRLIVLPEIKALFDMHRAVAENSITVECTSALPLTESQKAALIAVLNRHFECSINMSYHVDPRILGGVYLKAGDTVIDNSVLGQLTKLKEMMGG